MPTVPTGYAELDKALGADGKPFKGKKVSIQTQWIGGEGANFAAAVADFATATGIKIQVDSIGSSHETVLRTRIEGGKPPDLAMLAQPTPVLAYAAEARSSTWPRSWTPRSSATSTRHHRPGHPGRQDLGHPVQGRRQVDHLVPDQGLRGQGLHGPDDVGRADRSVRQDRRRRQQPVVHRRRRPGDATGWQATDWVEEVVLKTKGADDYNQWISHEVTFEDPGSRTPSTRRRQDLLHAKYVFGGNTAIVQHRPEDDPWIRCSTDDLANPKCWMQKIPTWYGPDFFPDQRASGGTPSKYIIGEDVGIFPFPTDRPGPELRRGLGRHADGARRPARGPGSRRVPLHAAGHPELDPAGSAISANTTTPADWYAGSYKLKVAADIVATAQGHRLRRLRPHAAAVGAGTFWTQTVNWANNGGTNTDAVLKAIDDSWPKPADDRDSACGARHLRWRAPLLFPARRGDGGSSN